MSFSSSYIITGNGESFSPYQTLSAGSLHIVDVENMHKDYKFLLHSNFPYLSVGISFKKEMIEEYLYSLKNEKNYFLFRYIHLFQSGNHQIVCTVSERNIKLQNEVSCRRADFFEAKAKEWLSLTINAFFQQ